MYKTYFSRCRENIVQTEASQLLPNNVIIIISILLRKQQNQKINTSYTNCRLDILKSLFFLLMKPQLFHLNPSQNNLFFFYLKKHNQKYCEIGIQFSPAENWGLFAFFWDMFSFSLQFYFVFLLPLYMYWLLPKSFTLHLEPNKALICSSVWNVLLTVTSGSHLVESDRGKHWHC